jgi:hypothetical protein
MDMTGFHFEPSTGDVQSALMQNAPAYVGNLQVTSPVTSTLYNCQFTYEGDGTDIVSDVGNDLIQALNTGLGLPFNFVGAVPDTASTIAVSPTNAAKTVTDSVTDALGNAVNKIVVNTTKSAATGVQNLLTPVEVAVGILAIVVIGIIFFSGKAGGLSASETGLSIGGK